MMCPGRAARARPAHQDDKRRPLRFGRRWLSRTEASSRPAAAAAAAPRLLLPERRSGFRECVRREARQADSERNEKMLTCPRRQNPSLRHPLARVAPAVGLFRPEARQLRRTPTPAAPGRRIARSWPRTGRSA